MPVGYWMDIGTPERHFQGTFDIITGAVATDGSAGSFDGAVIGAGSVVDPSARIGPLVVLGEGVHVGADASIERSVVLAGAHIGEGCVLRDCIVAERAKIGPHAELESDVGGWRGRTGARAPADLGGRADRPRGAL